MWNKLLTLEMTIFRLKVMMKDGLDFIFYFEIERFSSELLLPSAKKIGQERLNWPGRLAGISEGARGIPKYFFRPLFTIIFPQKIVISELIF